MKLLTHLVNRESPLQHKLHSTAAPRNNLYSVLFSVFICHYDEDRSRNIGKLPASIPVILINNQHYIINPGP